MAAARFRARGSSERFFVLLEYHQLLWLLSKHTGHDVGLLREALEADSVRGEPLTTTRRAEARAVLRRRVR